MKANNQPSAVAEQFRSGNEYKGTIGKGLNDQIAKNERFYNGDQWYGADTGNKPLVRRNIIKRIGEYKITNIGATSPIAVEYTVEGVDIPAEKEETQMVELPTDDSKPTDKEFDLFMEVLNGYFRSTCERIKFDDKKADAVKDAYVGGTGIIYTYWDDSIITGLYADEGKTMPIKGDIQCEVLDVRNVVFGEPNMTDLQSQPYIIIAQRKSVEEAKREAKRNHRGKNDIDSITTDESTYIDEPQNSKRTTVYTKFYKEWNENGDGFKIKGCKVTSTAIIKDEWDTQLSLYPLAMMNWLPEKNSIYGGSDITWQIPNQIAINRSLTATVWAVMQAGMPITVVNGDVVRDSITNNPGEVLKVYGSSEDVARAISYITPPNFSSPLLSAVESLTDSTLRDNGANDAALGDMNPDNASAIIQLKEAAKAPLQLYQNRFYSFIEDIARVWADFWVHNYGVRKLKVRSKDGLYYVPFNGERYKDLIVSARIDIASSAMYSPADTASTMLNLFQIGMISKSQALDGIPETILPDKDEYAKAAKEEEEVAKAQQEAQMMAQQMPQQMPQQEFEEVEVIEE